MDSCKFVIRKIQNFKPTIRQIYPCKLCNSVYTRRDNLKRHNINVVCDKPVAQHLNEKTWNVDEIISAFEVNDLEFLSPILWIMNQPQEIMTWDKKSGEIVYMQKRIQGSNIIKLLKTTCAGQMNALGIVQFCRGLIILNIPKNCIQNPKMKQTLESLLYVEKTSSNYHATPKYWKGQTLKISNG